MTKLDQPNIFEADYSKFFDSVNHRLIYENMITHLKMSPQLAMFVWELNKSVAKLPDVDLILEPDRAFSPEILAALGMMAPVKSRGVPQGAPTSCSTATIALRGKEKEYDILLYADDVIYFPKDE
jgi:hypothetical protein